jgi:hypothetical protein
MWYLAKPKPLKKPIKPDNQPMPTWFTPFKEKTTWNTKKHNRLN